jgi:hypothetical protein
MSRLQFDHDRRMGRSGEPDADADEQPSHGRSGAALNNAVAGARLRRLRDDPSGRRSLTGLEFRRLRSI